MFKVGDKARYLNSNHEGHIVDIQSTYSITIKDRISNLEAVFSPTSIEKYFDIGDHIKINNTNLPFHGFSGSVLKILSNNGYEVAIYGNSNIQYISNNDMELLMLNTKKLMTSKDFQIGDSVKISDTLGISMFMIGETGIVKSKNDVLNCVTVTLYRGGNWIMNPEQLEITQSSVLVSANPSLTNVISNLQYYNANTIKYTDQNFNPSHSHNWKKYIGLTYQEEFCDCGETRNKKGLYE